MKLEIKERESKEFYDEFLYMAFHYRNILKCPRQKVSFISLEAITYSVISLLLLVFFSYLYYTDNSVFHLIGLCFCGVVFLFSLFYLFIIYKNIYNHMHIPGTIIVEINEDGISITNQNVKHKLSYSEIELILVQHYGICFFPKNKRKPLMAISKKYQDFVLKGINKYNKERLVMDNSIFYQ